MRDRFSELIAAGVASFQEKPIGTDIPCLDPLVRMYNNVWGLLTDTHMSFADDSYIITGTFIDSPYWERFFYACNWGTTCFKLGSGFYSLENMISNYGYRVEKDVYNGDHVLRLVKRDDAAAAPEEGTCVACSPMCPVVVTTAESEIPHPLKEFFTEAQINDIKNAWNDAAGNAVKIVENLKTSRIVDASKFHISADNQYMVVGERLKIKL